MGDCFINDYEHMCGKNMPTQYWRNGYLEAEIWCKNHKLHRDGGPAFRQWTPDDNWKLICEEWWVNGKRIK